MRVSPGMLRSSPESRRLHSEVTQGTSAKPSSQTLSPTSLGSPKFRVIILIVLGWSLASKFTITPFLNYHNDYHHHHVEVNSREPIQLLCLWATTMWDYWNTRKAFARFTNLTPTMQFEIFPPVFNGNSRDPQSRTGGGWRRRSFLWNLLNERSRTRRTNVLGYAASSSSSLFHSIITAKYNTGISKSFQRRYLIQFNVLTIWYVQLNSNVEKDLSIPIY